MNDARRPASTTNFGKSPVLIECKASPTPVKIFSSTPFMNGDNILKFGDTSNPLLILLNAGLIICS